MIEVQAKFLTLDKPNANGRIYPRAVGEAIIEQAKEKIVFGVLGSTDLNEYQNSEVSHLDVSLGNASHTITDLRIEGDHLIGKIHLLETVSGRALAMVLSEMDFRPRGMGTIDENGVVSDYTLISIDAVKDGA